MPFFVSGMRCSWLILNLVEKDSTQKNIAPVHLDAYTTNKLCFTAFLICTVREYANWLVRTLYVLAEEDVWNSD